MHVLQYKMFPFFTEAAQELKSICKDLKSIIETKLSPPV